ncbi:MAG: hypothetical protein NTY77_09720 [Elusimicrobia bacterium]|nr:hypothetical protein [Elusimicrobiota bacterium]
MKNFICASVALLLQVPASAAGAAGSAKAARPASDAAILQEARKNVVAAFARIDSALSQAVPKVSSDPAGTLEGLCKTLSVASCAVIDKQGKITAMAPKENERFVGMDISKQDHAAKLLKHHQPVMGDVFTALEGYSGVGIYHPLFSDKGQFSGGVGVLVKPEELLAGALTPLEGKDGPQFSVIDTYGRLLYDSDKSQVGKMLFSDPLYSPHEDLLALGRRIVARTKGKGEYKFFRNGSKELVTKSALWDTAGLHGARWRLVLVQPK